MKNDETLNKQPHWRCRLCGHSTPLAQSVCSNPSCRADLGIYGEAVTPGQEDDSRGAWTQWGAEGQQREEEARRQEEEVRQRGAETQRSRDEARQQKEERQRQKTEKKVRDNTVRRDSRPVDGTSGGAMSVLVKIAAGLAAACVLLSLIDMVGWLELNHPLAYYTFYALTILADAACCAAICLCCVWCLNTKGAKPWPWLSIVLAVVGIPLSVWSLERNHLTGLYSIPLLSHGRFKSVGLPRFLSLAAEKGCLLHVLTKLACVAAAVLGPVSIFLYQRRQNKRPK